MRDFLDFEIEFHDEGPKFRITATSPCGHVEGDFTVPVTDDELLDFRRAIGPWAAVRRRDSSRMQRVKELGESLHTELFRDQVEAHFEETQRYAVQQGCAGVRVRLKFGSGRLADIPWEYLYNRKTDEFVALAELTPLVRQVPNYREWFHAPIESPLKVLVVLSSPYDQEEIDVDAEWLQLNTSLAPLRDRGLIQVDRLKRSTIADLGRWLLDHQYHVFHFIGHGEYDPNLDSGVLLFQTERGRSDPIPADRLRVVLNGQRNLRLAIVNACEGARTSEHDLFAGIAQTLVRGGVPCVVAMQHLVTNRTAIAFTNEFYNTIARGYPVDAAVTQFRRSIYVQGEEVAWGLPVIYMNTKHGRLLPGEVWTPTDQTTESIPADVAEDEPGDAVSDARPPREPVNPTAICETDTAAGVEEGSAPASARPGDGVTRKEEVAPPFRVRSRYPLRLILLGLLALSCAVAGAIFLRSRLHRDSPVVEPEKKEIARDTSLPLLAERSNSVHRTTPPAPALSPGRPEPVQTVDTITLAIRSAIRRSDAAIIDANRSQDTAGLGRNLAGPALDSVTAGIDSLRQHSRKAIYTVRPLEIGAVQYNAEEGTAVVTVKEVWSQVNVNMATSRSDSLPPQEFVWNVRLQRAGRSWVIMERKQLSQRAANRGRSGSGQRSHPL